MVVVMTVMIMTVMAMAAYSDDNLSIGGGRSPGEDDHHDQTKDDTGNLAAHGTLLNFGNLFRSARDSRHSTLDKMPIFRPVMRKTKK